MIRGQAKLLIGKYNTEVIDKSIRKNNCCIPLQFKKINIFT